RKRWEKIYKWLPGKWSFNRAYDKLIANMDQHSKTITNTYMTGSLRNYMALIIGTMAIVTFTFMLMKDGFTILFDDVFYVTFIEVVVVGIVICGAIATVFANSNLAIILITGITGYGVAILFVLYRAPDLALTQLVIETVSIVLFYSFTVTYRN